MLNLIALFGDVTVPGNHTDWAVAIGTGLAAFVANVIIQIMTWNQARKLAKETKRLAEERIIADAKATQEREEVKRKLEEEARVANDKRDELKAVVEKGLEEHKAGAAVIHALVNSGNTANKRTIAILARDKANLTRRQEDIEFADKMEQELKDHEAMTSAIDPAVLVKANFPNVLKPDANL